jgi:hypothetical protein
MTLINNVMKIINKYYLIHFDNLGYFSKKQHHSNWTFNENIELAFKYKTLKGALKIIEHTLELNSNINDITIEILQENIITNDNSKNISYKIKQTIKKDDILYHLKKEKEKSYSKKYSSIIIEPIKKEFLDIPADDPYWN